MAQQELIQLFENLKIRVIWDDEQEKYFFSIVDIIRVLNDSETIRQATIYWSVLKNRLKKEGADEVFTNCKQLKLTAEDGKQRLTDVADKEQLFRIIQSVPSKKAEPIKQWLAKVGAERISQMQDPEKNIDQAVADWHRLGYSESWINQRIKSIEVRKGLTDEWDRGGIRNQTQYAYLTDIMSKIWSGLTTKEYKRHKGLTTQNLRDNMTNTELLLNALAEQAATDISRERNPKGLAQNAQVAAEGASIAKTARQELEKKLGHTVISNKKAIDYITPKDELPFNH